MIKKATTLEEIRKYCRSAPLEGEELKSFFVETDQARKADQNTRKRLLQALEREDARILFYGHMGCGKSTEINKLLEEEKDRFFPVKFTILTEMNPIAFRADDLLLIIAERLLNAAKEANLNVSDGILAKVRDYFSDKVLTNEESREMGLALETGVEVKTGLLAPILNVFANFRSEIRYNAHGTETKTSIMRKRPGDLLAQVNFVVEAVRKAVPKDKRLLIIVEDLDKIGLQQAREAFVNNVTLLTGVRTNVIYTIPVFLFHSPDLQAFKPHFDSAVALRMIKTFERGGEPAFGLKVVKKVVCTRLGDDTITEKALDLLVEKTGGVLRHVFDVINSAAVLNNAKLPLEVEHIRSGLNQLRLELWQSIALPIEPMPQGPEKVEELYQRLTENARHQKEGKKTPPQSDPINQILLKTCALVEYNGEGWLGVHPLVLEFLQASGRPV